jgi:DNA-binding NarL/FixJ family response regulator
MKLPRILIADDHQMFSQGLAALLAGTFEIVGSVADGQTLVDEAARLKPDVILLDISMPMLNGLDAARKLSSTSEPARVIFLTMHADKRLLTEAFRAGASGYVLKQSAGDELIHAIQHVLAGNKYISPQLSSDKQSSTDGLEDRHTKTLTPRQREVLQLIIEGLTMKEIANKLGISTRTAESYKYDMMSELGVTTTAELIQYAIKLGMSK